jgi:hypothetical protein
MNKESYSRENYQLDMTPETATFVDSALVVNRSYTDSDAGVTITPISIDSNGAFVNVTFGNAPAPSPCIEANPTMSVSPSDTRWIIAGSSVSYTVTLTNNNSSNCTNNNFSLQSTTPFGWNSRFDSPSLTISPGTSAISTFQIVSPNSERNGFFSVNLTATNVSSPTYNTSTPVNLSIYSLLGVTVTTNQPVYTISQTAVISTVVTANGSPMAGANVTFKIQQPDGTFITSTSTSASNGGASFSYRFSRKKNFPGLYLVTVAAHINGVSGNGSTNFELR